MAENCRESASGLASVAIVLSGTRSALLGVVLGGVVFLVAGGYEPAFAASSPGCLRSWRPARFLLFAAGRQAARSPALVARRRARWFALAAVARFPPDERAAAAHGIWSGNVCDGVRAIRIRRTGVGLSGFLSRVAAQHVSRCVDVSWTLRPDAADRALRARSLGRAPTSAPR